MSNRRRIRGAKPRVMTVAEVSRVLTSGAGLFHLEHQHQRECPAGHDGTGRGCICTPDVFLRAHDRRLIAEVKG